MYENSLLFQLDQMCYILNTLLALDREFSVLFFYIIFSVMSLPSDQTTQGTVLDLPTTQPQSTGPGYAMQPLTPVISHPCPTAAPPYLPVASPTHEQYTTTQPPPYTFLTNKE